MGFHVIPSYAQKFESLIKTDAETIIYNNIEKRGHLGDLFPGIRIHADGADPQRHRLHGVVVIKVKGGELEQIVSAREVEVLFQRGERNNEVLLRLYDARRIDNNTTSSIGQMEMVIPVPSLWKDHIKFKKLGELKAIQQDMMLFSPVRDLVGEFRGQFLAESFFAWCQERLSQGQHAVDLTYRGEHRLRLQGRGMVLQGGKSSSRSKNSTAQCLPDKQGWVTVDYFHRLEDTQPERRYQAKTGRLTVAGDNNPAAVLKLEDVQWSHTGQGRETNLAGYDFPGIGIPAELTAASSAVGLDEVLQARATLWGSAAASARLAGLGRKIESECRDLHNRIEVELHTRLAFGVSCVVLVLLGAALGIIFRSSHLLMAFGISFIPATLCLITIFTGKHVVEQSNAGSLGGIMFLWSGIAVVAGVDMVIYRRLLRR